MPDTNPNTDEAPRDRTLVPDLDQLQELKRLATEQRGALQHGQVQRFEALLELRQAVIDLITPAAPPENVIRFPSQAPAEKERLQALDVLNEIMTLDRANEQALRSRLDEVRESLGAVRRGRRAQAGYAGPGAASAGRIERTG